MKTRSAFVLILVVMGAAGMIATIYVARSRPPKPESSPSESQSTVPLADTTSLPAISESTPTAEAPQPKEKTLAFISQGKPAPATNKLERLNQIRESFRAMAAGDPATALRAAKQITDETERETALLALVSEWTHGELRSPRLRAHAIDTVGLEAALGIEIAARPDLARLWAEELTEGPGRTALFYHIAINSVGSDPAAAFALSDELPEADRRTFLDGVFANWGGADTDAALKYADQLPDPNDRDAAIGAIRTAAPVGIGAALKVEDGYPVINQLLPGTPAEKSGQLRAGDRIVALAQGDSRFVDALGLPLDQIVQQIRGAPNSMLQLQVLAADAPPNSPPRYVTIIRDQLRFTPQKR